MVVMTSEPEFPHDALLKSMDSRAHEAVLVRGAQSFVAGRDTLTRYAGHLKNNGIDLTPEHFD